MLHLSPIPDAPNVMYVYLTDRDCCGLISVIFYVTKDGISPINMMFSLLSRNPIHTFQVSEMST